MKTGIYYFTWYDERRWQEAPTSAVPLIGQYDSTDASTVAWQLDLMRYCGVDYVIFQVVPEDDWSFRTVARGIETAIDYLRGTDMQWSFLLDAKSGPGLADQERSEADAFAAMYRSVYARGWADRLVRGATGRPLLFLFAPRYADALAVTEEIAPESEWRMPIFLPAWHWETWADVRAVIPSRYVERVSSRIDGFNPRRLPLAELLAAVGYVPFWGESVRVCRGMASIIPGYDDSLLKRDPQLAPLVPRRDGETLREQFAAAVEAHAEHIFIYGWNEYFESTCIEPTRQFGMQYVELLRSLIAEARRAPSSRPPLRWTGPAPRRPGIWDRVRRLLRA